MVERGWLKWCEVLLVSILLFASPAHNIFASFFWACLPVWPGCGSDERASGLNTNNDCVERRLCTVQKSKSSSFWFPESCEQHRKQTHGWVWGLSLSSVTSVFLWAFSSSKGEFFLCVFSLTGLYDSEFGLSFLHKLKIFPPRFQPFKWKHTGLAQNRDVINIVYKVCFVILYVI